MHELHGRGTLWHASGRRARAASFRSPRGARHTTTMEIALLSID